MHACMYVYMDVCMYVHVCTMYVSMYMHVYACMYIRIHMYMYMYLNTCIQQLQSMYATLAFITKSNFTTALQIKTIHTAISIEI